MTFPGPHRTIIVEPIDLPRKHTREQPASPSEDPGEPEPAEAPPAEPERQPAKHGRASGP